MIINRQKPIEFNSPVEVIFEREELKKAIKWYATKPVARLKHVFLFGRYYAVSVYGEKIHIHRLLVMFWENRDLERDEYVHHKDGNRFNNLRENLEIMPASLHQSITNKGRKQTQDWIRSRIMKTADKKRGKKYPKHIYENPDLIKEEKK